MTPGEKTNTVQIKIAGSWAGWIWSWGVHWGQDGHHRSATEKQLKYLAEKQLKYMHKKQQRICPSKTAKNWRISWKTNNCGQWRLKQPNQNTCWIQCPAIKINTVLQNCQYLTENKLIDIKLLEYPIPAATATAATRHKNRYMGHVTWRYLGKVNAAGFVTYFTYCWGFFWIIWFD